MSYLINDPASFTDEMTDGFVAVHADLVRKVEGGVVRASRTPRGQVAVVIGGGSGHYPAFAGLVGQGLAHGAAMGNVFASPSAQQVHSVARAAASDAGVLLMYGNYAGDVLNFDQAQERLRAEGIDCRTVTVTDDVSSASRGERHKRRGITGDFPVFRVAAWAAEQGRSLDEVWALASRANERTRSLGVAFSGCTLPGARAPLFTVPAGRMAVGMGIHGEPGITESEVPTADGLARLLVDELLEEWPEEVERTRGARVAVVVNGLGSVKTEELFVLYRSVAVRLAAAGLEPVQPEVGELVTSFEMAGASLTLVWLDDELERAWTSPALTPAYRRGGITAQRAEARDEDAPAGAETDVPPATQESRAAAAGILAAVQAGRAPPAVLGEELGHLDAVAGDGDHGIGMQRGVTAAAAAAGQAVDAGAGARTALTRAADAWADRAGGTSGALWGVALRALAAHLDDEHRPTRTAVVAGVGEAAQALARAGKAEAGDKTMLDVLVPYADALRRAVTSGQPLTDAAAVAAATATAAAQATAELVPRLGRARPHAQKSIGTPDPGAVSLALAVTAVAATLTTQEEPAHE